MQFVPFPESNRSLGRPADMSAEECGTLEVYADGKQCISCWQLSAEEIETCIMNDGRIWLGVHGGQSQPPVFLTVNQPPMPAVQHEVTDEIEAALQEFASHLPHSCFAGRAPQRGDELRRLNPDLRQYRDDRPLDLGQLYFVSSDEIQALHLHKLREAYRQHGQPAVVAYLAPYKHFLNAPNTLIAA